MVPLLLAELLLYDLVKRIACLSYWFSVDHPIDWIMKRWFQHGTLS
jgi:hypothetical protein